MNKIILFVLGTRPELIKLSSLISLCKKQAGIDVRVCSTTQHHELLNEHRDYFNINFDIELALIRREKGLTSLHVNMMEGMDKVYKTLKPDCVIVQGDTTTSFVATMTAYYNKIDVAHVEAGLRTYDIYAPFPEEANRRLIATLAGIHFAPSKQARDNLLLEGVELEKIFITGNTGVDAFMQVKKHIEEAKTPAEIDELCQLFPKKNRRMILVTCHRRESFDGGLRNICLGIKDSAEKLLDCDFVMPMHANLDIRKVFREQFKDVDNIYLLDSLSYPVFVYFMLNAFIIITDSGGVQEEASLLGKPVVIIREKTERVELLQRQALLVGFDTDEIKHAIFSLVNDDSLYKRYSCDERHYGYGHASELIWNNLSDFLSKKC